MKKIGIVGGGIAGLTAAYKASKKGLDSILFEESSITGGRLEYCASLTSPRFQPHLYDLIEEIGMKELTVPFSPEKLGMYVRGEVAPYSSMMKMIEKMPEKDQKQINGMIKEAMESNFRVDNPSDNLKELRNISFAEYLKDFSKEAIEKFVKPILVFTFEKEINLEKYSAEYGLFHIRFGMEMGQDNVFTFEEGVRNLSDILEKKARDKGTEIKLSSEVKEVEKTKEGFKIHYEKVGEKKTQEVENVIFATPCCLESTEKMFEGVEIDEGFSYESTSCLIGEGELKGDKKVIMGTPGNDKNLRFLFAGPYNTHYIYPFHEDKPIDFESFYKDVKINQEREIEKAFPIISPGVSLPKIETDVEGAYLCGDYYFYPLMETSIVTAQKAVEKIKNS